MSFNILMVPVAIALRVAMGEEGYNNWIKANEKRMPTKIREDNELQKLVGMAGYDLIDYGSFKKTHFGNTFFIWEKDENQWTAVFSIHDDANEIDKLIQRLNKASGKDLFQTIQEEQQVKEKTYPTNFRDEETLKSALGEADIPYILEKGAFQCHLNGCHLKLSEGNKAYYEAQVKVNQNMNKSLIYLNILDEEYKKVVQEETYRNLLEKIHRTSDMEIEEEYIEEDDIVVVVKCNT